MQAHRRLTLVIISLAFIALVFAGVGVYIENNISLSIDLSSEGLSRFSRWLFGTASILLLVEPNPVPNNIYYTIARILAVLFSLLAVSGIFLSLSRTARNALMRFKFCFYWRKPVVVIFGLSQVAKEITKDSIKKHKVYVVFDEEKEKDLGDLKRESIVLIDIDNFDNLEKVDRLKTILFRARYIFIALGTDSLNLSLAGKVSKLSPVGWSSKSKLGSHLIKCFVQLEDTEMINVLHSSQLLKTDQKKIRFDSFSTHKLISEGLCLEAFLDRRIGFLKHQGLEGKSDEPNSHDYYDSSRGFHAVIHGFGLHAQSIVLDIARLAHFSSLKRPKISILGTVEEHHCWNQFLKKYPALTADFENMSISKVEADWEESFYGPFSKEYKTKQIRESQPIVEYAALIEFLELENDVDVWTTKSKELKEIYLGKDIDPIFIVCTEDETRNFEVSLRLKHLFDATSKSDSKISLFTFLPYSDHLEELFNGLSDTQKVKIHAFGKIDSNNLVSKLTQEDNAGKSLLIRKFYEALSSKDGNAHPDFSLSNLEAVQTAEIKFESLGIRFNRKKEGEKFLLEKYLNDDLNKKLAELQAKGKLPLEIESDEIAPEEYVLLTRLLLTNQLRLNGNGASIKEARRKLIEQLIEEFLRDMEAFTGYDRQKLSIAARVEHNRWMAERLSRGWKYGPESNELKQRLSFVSWDGLEDVEKKLKRKFKKYDEHLPVLILAIGSGNEKRYAYQKREWMPRSIGS
ncbi:MAG: hypothetical protein HWE07_13930 [Cytophagia bacterium]|nr:hypothetical protein [Cytophagia bacterium]